MPDFDEKFKGEEIVTLRKVRRTVILSTSGRSLGLWGRVSIFQYNSLYIGHL